MVRFIVTVEPNIYIYYEKENKIKLTSLNDIEKKLNPETFIKA